MAEKEPGLARKLTPIEYYQGLQPRRTLVSRAFYETHMDEFRWVSSHLGIIEAILENPPSVYDRQFAKLSRPVQREQLQRQQLQSAKMVAALGDYFEEHKDEFWDMSDLDIYQTLSLVAFGTEDSDEIVQKFAQSQRRGFRLAILNFITDKDRLRIVKNDFDTDPRKTIEDLFGFSPEQPFSVEVLPVGVVMSMDSDDYIKVLEGSNLTPEDKTLGVTIFYESLPVYLYGKVALIDAAESDPGKLISTRKHEMEHILFESYFAQQDTHHLGDGVRDDFTGKQLAQHLSKVLMESVRGEILAYLSSGSKRFYLGLQAEILNLNVWDRFLNEARGSDSSITEIYQKEFQRYLDTLRFYMWTVNKLLGAAEEGINGLSRDEAMALLRLTPVQKAAHLGKYFGMQNNQQALSTYNTETKDALEKLRGRAETLTKNRLLKLLKPIGENWYLWDRGGGFERILLLRLILPPEALDIFLAWTTGINDKGSVNVALFGIDAFVSLYRKTLDEEALGAILKACDFVKNKRTGDKFKEERTRAEELALKVQKLLKN